MGALYFLFLLVLGLALLIFYLRRRGVTPKRSQRYHAVSIVAADDACNVVKQLGRRRMLSSSAPLLPLAGCDCPHCRCRYVHHRDRRALDRRFPYRRLHQHLHRDLVQERRRVADRRH